VLPVDVETHDFSGGPAMRNRPDVSSNELLNEVMSTDDCAGKIKHAFAILDANSSVVV
jgi:hypothetical protein